MVLYRDHLDVDGLAGSNRSLKQSFCEDQVGRCTGVAVGVAHLGIGQRPPRALAIDGIGLDQPLAGLGAAGAGVHTKRAADRAGDAVIERKPGQFVLQGKGRQALVESGGADADTINCLANGLPKPLGRKADDDAGNAAVTDQEVRADADHGHRDGGRDVLQEQRKIVGVGRLEEELSEAADPEPGERSERCVRGQPAADTGEIAETDVFHGSLSSRRARQADAAAHWPIA